MYEVTPLTDEGLWREIVRLADHVGVAIEAALIERLAGDAADEPGVLPLVQETIVLLWERLADSCPWRVRGAGTDPRRLQRHGCGRSHGVAGGDRTAC